MVIHHPASQCPPHPTAWGMATGQGGRVGKEPGENLGGIEGRRGVAEAGGENGRMRNRVQMDGRSRKNGGAEERGGYGGKGR